MRNNSLKNFISEQSSSSSDTFVGIKCEGGNLKIFLPVGFKVDDDDSILRKELLFLLNAIKYTTERKISDDVESIDFQSNKRQNFPISSFLYVISDFLKRGYYKEREVIYSKNKRGKIHWGKTIKNVRPFILQNEANYLNFIVRKTPLSENELITLIHEYCVYESFQKIGWLYSFALPNKPRIKFNKALFINILNKKYSNSFVEDNKTLFSHLIKIVKSSGDELESKDYTFGTNRFEYVWELLIDEVFGIRNKSEYFPNTKWNLIESQTCCKNSTLEPDSIMIHDKKIYILDAKYYKFGMTRNHLDLPGSSSINKQITYGEYVSQLNKFDDKNIYNAFLMPFSKDEWDCPIQFKYIGDASSEWKSNKLRYEKIKGILVDTNYLLKAFTLKDNSAISDLSKLIEDSFLDS